MTLKSLVEFYKERLDVGNDRCNVLCDLTFLKWLSRNKHFDAISRLKSILFVDDVTMKTTKCLNSEFEQWFSTTKRGERNFFMKNISLIVCKHPEGYSSKKCFESKLKKYERCFVCSNDYILHQKTKTPVITVRRKSLFVLKPEDSLKEEYINWCNTKQERYENSKKGDKRKFQDAAESSLKRGRKRKKSTRDFFLNL
ncbi:hypothetical protein QVD17_38334 [Tagetes erecta]|uniref:Uncharacterized protein n=1 Tax=Tagetes erecta TaxID=13708 RepID=A0AAD8NG41_TARER|nr:hypothetical protein QVD17_38334 [Tagetes erecta]